MLKNILLVGASIIGSFLVAEIGCRLISWVPPAMVVVWEGVQDSRPLKMSIPKNPEASRLNSYPQRQLSALCSTLGVPVLDLLPILQLHAEENIFYDQCHLTARGNRIVASAISF